MTWVDVDTKDPAVRAVLDRIEGNIEGILEINAGMRNDAILWDALNEEVTTYLLTEWEAGVLWGNTASDAFSVQVGAGTTMTAQDILDGRLMLSVMVMMSEKTAPLTLTFFRQVAALE